MNEENIQRTDQRTGPGDSSDSTTEKPGVVVAGPDARNRVQKMDPAAEDDYWRTNYSNQAYVERNAAYLDYQTAYRIGYEGPDRYPGKKFAEVQIQLQRDYEKSKGNSRLNWEQARHAARDAWNRIDMALPGGTDENGH